MSRDRKSAPARPANTRPGPAPTAKSAGPTPASWLLWAGLLTVLVVVAYLRALHAGFIWDDDAHVTGNGTLHTLDGLRAIWFQPTSIPQYYPLVHTTFWLEYQLWGLHAFGYHLDNVLLHAVVAILLARILTRLQIPGAWLAAAIFALHPVEVESVAWISERKNVLSALFYFCAALAYLRCFALTDANGPAQSRWNYYFGALALFVAALLSKTVTCSLPAALLLVRWWKTGRLQWRDFLPLVPFFVIGAALGLSTAWLEKHHVGAQGGVWTLTLAQRCLIAGRALWFYAGKLVWPASLSFVYPRWDVNADQWWQWLFPAAAVGVIAVLWLARKRLGRGPLAAVLFFAGTLAPALGFINVFPMRYTFVADHYQYLAGAGLIVLFAAGVSRLTGSARSRFEASRELSASGHHPLPVQWGEGRGEGRFGFFVIAVVLLILLLFGLLTWQRTAAYRDLETLWRDTIAKNPRCWIAHNNLGLELEGQGRNVEAMSEYQQALPLAPDFPETYNNLGNLLVQERRLDEALVNYFKVLKLDPKFVPSINSIGVIMAMQGKTADAATYFREAIRLQPDYARAHQNLGNALKAQNDLAGAVREYQEAVRYAPQDPTSHNSLGVALEAQGKTADALREYREYVRLKPDDPAAHLTLGVALARFDQRGPAIAELKTALRLKPDLPDVPEFIKQLEAPGAGK